jgi:hypothetical protein
MAAMTRPGNLTYVAFGWMLVVGVLGGLFVAAEAIDDPGGWAGVALVAAWLVPLAALAWLATRHPGPARPLFVWATVVVATFTLLDAAFRLVPRGAGPVAAVTVFVLAVALGFLGLHEPLLAGRLLLVLGAAQLVASVFQRSGGGGHGLLVGGSSFAVVAPVLIGGLLFALAGRHEHHSAPASSSAGHAAAR